MPRNFQGELLPDIRDTGADPTDPSTRLSETRAEQDFHTDGADIIGLHCLRGAKRGGESRMVSARVTASGVFWGAPGGPGTDPADTVCNSGGGNVIVE